MKQKCRLKTILEDATLQLRKPDSCCNCLVLDQKGFKCGFGFPLTKKMFSGIWPSPESRCAKVTNTYELVGATYLLDKENKSK